LADLGLLWQNDRLHVAGRFQSDLELIQKVFVALIYTWRFVPFSDSRWVTVGRGCRTFTMAFATGITFLVQKVIASPSANKFYLQGFQKLNSQIREFVVLAPVCSYPSGSLLSDLLEDDRISMRVEALQKSLKEELEYISHNSRPVWGFLTALVGVGTTGLGARTYQWPLSTAGSSRTLTPIHGHLPRGHSPQLGRAQGQYHAT
jgi:hypothetical protein